jgi:hypothetical protein
MQHDLRSFQRGSSQVGRLGWGFGHRSDSVREVSQGFCRLGRCGREEECQLSGGQEGRFSARDRLGLCRRWRWGCGEGAGGGVELDEVVQGGAVGQGEESEDRPNGENEEPWQRTTSLFNRLSKETRCPKESISEKLPNITNFGGEKTFLQATFTEEWRVFKGSAKDDWSPPRSSSSLRPPRRRTQSPRTRSQMRTGQESTISR